MLKRILIFSFFLFAVFYSYAKGAELALVTYVIFPMAFFPVFYFFDTRARFFFISSVLVLLAVYSAWFSRERSFEVTLMGGGHLALFAALFFYRGQWEGILKKTIARNETASKELQTLEQKHTDRLESLHHLEKQVSSLMNLFEIARDFSESLDFESLAGLLHKKVMQELPFRRMQLIEMRQAQANASVSRVFTITAEGVQTNDSKFSQEELETFLRLRQSGQTSKKEGNWTFPIYATPDTMDILKVEGADPDDFAKFEVLVSHLTLQVKKIRLYQAVKELSIIDGLTGIFVRRHFEERFEEEVKRCIKYGHHLAVFMLDIDHFKRYNDDFGHLVGDATLKEVATILQSNLRKVDIVGRYGGEEFIMVIPETQREGALEVAERIRSSIARHAFKIYDEETRVTVSIGIALFPGDVPEQMRSRFQQDLVAELIQRSDKALYKAKEEGRNRVVLYQEL